MIAPRLLLLVAGVVFLAATAARADVSFPQNPHIAAAQSALDNGDLDKVSVELQKALAQPDNSDDALVEIYKLQGIVALSRGNNADARQALEKLFQARPDYELPKGTSPKIRALFTAVQNDVRQKRVQPVTLDFDPVTHLTAGGPAQLQAHVADLPPAARVRGFYRRTGTESFSSVDFQRGDQGALSATLPAADLPLDAAPFGLEYYVEVEDAAGRRLAGRGDALSPLTARVEAPGSDASLSTETPPPVASADDVAWYNHWYIWVGAGVVAAAGSAVGVYYATRPSTGTLPVTVSVNGQ